MRTIRNNTPRQLEIIGASDQKIVLAPLEQRQFKDEDLIGFDLSAASREGTLTHFAAPPSDLMEILLGLVMMLGFMLAIAGAIAASQDTPALFQSRFTYQLAVWISAAVILVVIVAAVAIYKTGSFRLLARGLGQTVSLIMILAIGLGLPAATVFFFGDGRSLLASPSTILFARILQVCFIGIASLMPVLLFFLFDRYQLSTLRNRLYRDLFRLDWGLQIRSQIDAKYGSQIHEAFGPEDDGRGRLAPGTRWPVLVCAFVVTMGWLAAFKPVGSMDAAGAAHPLFPERGVLAFGFLGAYFFGLQLIARRYARGDLKPKAYGYITIRILVVAVLSWVLELFSPTSVATLMIAFLIGIVPDEFFTFVREKFRKQAAGKLVPEAEKHPLTKLEGIDLYDRARLEQEGIVNVESFAHHDLIHLVLETQMPVPRLVDWMDQAILYLHIIEEEDVVAPAKSVRRTLRSYGIRTATDLLSCWNAAQGRGELNEFKMLLDGDKKPYRLEVIRDSLLDDEWLERVKNWRQDSPRDSMEVVAVPTTYEGKLDWAEYMEQQHKYKEALTTLQEAMEIQEDAVVRVRLAGLLATVPVLSLQDRTAAKVHAKRAFELGQFDLDVLTKLVDICENMDDIDGALAACDRALEVFPDPKNDKAKKAALDGLKKKKEQLEQKKAQSAPAVAAAGDGRAAAAIK
ncbi:MAG TPA: hypothetical protein VL866_10790 [Pyrinomonadaceae bacterium]|nr:hypothetical protein [Pyrinomonadaceae bacterium]